MSEYPGMGVILGMLGGNEETVNSIKASIGKTITKAELEGDNLCLRFSDGKSLRLWDDGQSCCEHRYMVTDDDLSLFHDCVFTDIELKEAPSVPDEYGEHEVQFLDIKTSIGSFQMATHNEHNGYYGGFWIVAKEE